MRNRLLTLAAIFAMLGSSSVFVNGQSTAPSATFPGSGLGPVPDGTTCGTAGAPLNITYNVSGIAAAPSSVSIDMTFSPPHTWMGDIVATLIAPNGTSFVVFGNTGSTVAGGVGDSSDLAGPYTFNDAATGDWWAAATAAGAAVAVPSGAYRTSQQGGAGSTGAVTNFTAAFAGIPTSNGTWTLRLTDQCPGDTTSVSATSLTLTGGTPVALQHVVDYDGDGKTDWSVVRNTGGGANGQVTWFNQFNGSAGGSTVAFGLASDFFVPSDYDGDSKTDISVWRPGTAGTAAWYTLLSGTNTLRSENFGQTGDDPTVVGDYNGDGKADIAVYRAGASAGLQSTWYYRTVVNGPTFVVNWGTFGDFPAPGDYDGDRKNDFVIQRNDGGGHARFWTLFATGTTKTEQFGTPTDVIVPGDYDGDGKTDIATTRASAGQILWLYDPSSTPADDFTGTTFGNSATDSPVQGDYDADGKTDFAVWRPNADPTMTYFYVNRSNGSGLLVFEWGQTGDYAVANYNVH